VDWLLGSHFISNQPFACQVFRYRYCMFH
jgi:hypothetical protein